MNCSQAELEITAVDRATLRVCSEELKRHVATCTACRQLLADEQLIDDAIDLWKKDRVPGDDDPARVERILSTWLAAEAPGLPPAPARHPVREDRRWLWSRVAGFATVAAASLVAAWPLLTSTRNAPSADVVDARLNGPGFGIPRHENPAAVTLARPLSDEVASLWHEVRAGSERAATATVQQWEQLPALSPLPLDVVASQPPTSPDSSDRESLLPDPWRQLGQPLGEGMTEAFGFLGRTLPAVQVPAS